MESSARLAERLSDVFLNGQWIAGTNFSLVLDDISFEEANRSVGGLNSMYRLAYHVDYYLRGLCRVLEKNELKISDRFSFPEAEIDAPDRWENFKIDLQLNAQRLISLVQNMTDAALDATFVQPQYGSNRRNLEALIEHSYYHLGQMTLIKKLLRGHDGNV